jgi:hypothetical protein
MHLLSVSPGFAPVPASSISLYLTPTNISFSFMKNQNNHFVTSLECVLFSLHKGVTSDELDGSIVIVIPSKINRLPVVLVW